LQNSAIAAASIALASCAQNPAPAPTEAPAAEPTATSGAIVANEATSTPVPTTAATSQYKQAPALDELVKSGKLPPVDQRIPADVAITAVKEVGKYGGILHVASGDTSFGDIKMYMTDPPIKWKADLTGYEPGLAKAYEWSDDGKTFTLHMRKGVKWSDGQPYTSADWKFWWEDLVNAADQKLYSVPGYMRNTDGTPITLSFPDDYTVVWTSTDRALWIDPYFLAQGFWEFNDPKMKPAHFLKAAHPKYTTGKTWDDLSNLDKWWMTPDYPTVMAWCFDSKTEDGSNFVMKRNPYYWRIDTEGNQLPYIDSINIEIVKDDQVRLLNASQGKYEVMIRGLGAPTNQGFLQEGAAKGNYKILTGWKVGTGGWPCYFINLDYVEGGKNYEDDTAEHAKEVRDLLRADKFRQALSVGVDRQRVIDVAWKGIGEAKNYTLSPQSWHFAGEEGQKVYKEWAASFTEYSIEKANSWLDEVGMKKGSDGFRTLPSGKPFQLWFDVDDWGGDMDVNMNGTMEIKAQYEKNLALSCNINNVKGQPVAGTRHSEGQYMLKVALEAEMDIWTFPDQMFAVRNNYSFPLAGRWFGNGGDACKVSAPEKQYAECGMKPEPGSPQEALQALYRKGQNTKSIEDRHKIVYEAIKIFEEHGPFHLGIAGDVQAMAIAKNTMRNVLDFGVTGPWAPATPGNQIPAQWWIEA
jgi:peptide/nickel transport system substrate-binding protein